MNIGDNIESFLNLQRYATIKTQDIFEESVEYQQQVALATLEMTKQAASTEPTDDARRELVPDEVQESLDDSSMCVWEWHVDTDHVEYTDAWAEMVGHSPDEIDPTLDAWLDRCHPTDRDDVEAALTALADGESEYGDIEHRIHMASGNWKTVRAIGQVIAHDDDPTRVLGVHFDVDSGGGIEQAGSQSRDIFTQGPAIVFKCRDKEGWPVEYSSENVETVLGYTPDQFDTGALEYADLVHEADRGRVLDELDTVTDATEQFRHDPYRIVTSDGDVRWMLGFSTPIRVDGEVTHVLCHLVDITERKRIEQRLQEQRDNLELLNEVVRHDIRNDLQVATTYAELLEDHVDEEGKQHLQTLQDSVENATGLTKTARDLAVVMLRDDDETEPVSLAETLVTEIDALRESYPDAEVTVEDSLPRIAVASDDMLNTVFRNLLTNAVQHNDSQTPEVRVAAETSDDEVHVRIADNGPGIPDESKESIFGKGEQGLDSDGTGIGLYLVESLVDSYGGDVWVEDNDPTGAVFHVTLPRVE